MNFDGYTPQAVPRFGSLVESDDVTELPLGTASDVQNSGYRAQSVGPRDGKGIRLKFGAQGNSIGGFGVLRYLAPDNSGQENIQIVACTQDGNVWGASPFTQASVTQLTTDDMINAANITRSTGLYAQCSQVYNRMHIAQGNLMTGVAPALVVDGETMNCDPISDKPFGDVWKPLTRYRVGQVVSPTNQTNTNIYYCLDNGITGPSEPVWPTLEGATVVDGSGVGNVTWQQLTIVCTSGLTPPSAPIPSSSPAGTLIAPGSTLFLVCTWSNQFGESTAYVTDGNGNLGNVLEFLNNTGAAVNLNVVLPLVPADILSLPAQYAVTACNLYGFITSGTPNSVLYLDPTSYAYIGSASPGSTTLVSAVPVGNQLPTQNNAFTTAAGNVSSGVRYMIVLYETRTGYICGYSAPFPVSCNITVDSRAMLVQNIPIGPYNCVARICAFTVAGQGSAGPYFYIATDDFVDPGLGALPIKMTATKIPDNVTTTTFFDFLDSYLPGASEVTDYFDRIEVPPCSDIYQSKTMNRVAYTGCVGYPSSILITDLEDQEAIRVPGSIVDVSLTDGDRAVCLRELGVTQIAYKENSAHAVTENDGDPSVWDVSELWRGKGPCGPRAIDVCSTDGQNMHAFAHVTGGYVYSGNGAPNHITLELEGTKEDPGLWDRINWAYSYLIRTAIDPKNRLIRFFVPLDDATHNDVCITVDYKNGLDDPIIFIQRTGREVPNITGRKWSLDSFAANDAVYVPQRTSATP